MSLSLSPLSQTMDGVDLIHERQWYAYKYLIVLYQEGDCNLPPDILPQDKEIYRFYLKVNPPSSRVTPYADWIDLEVWKYINIDQCIAASIGKAGKVGILNRTSDDRMGYHVLYTVLLKLHIGQEKQAREELINITDIDLARPIFSQFFISLITPHLVRYYGFHDID